MQESIGIWGFGIVGKSILEFLRSSVYLSLSHQLILEINILDRRNLSIDELELLKKYNANFIFQNSSDGIENFLKKNDKIIISAGIDASAYKHYSSKIIGEIDLFAIFFKKPSIAITGTVGKTTITKLIEEFSLALPLKAYQEKNGNINIVPKNNQKFIVGGNIGRGLLSLIANQENIDFAILELSSFQLDLNNFYSPSIALWTNLYPNHLDRHINMEGYFEAKFKLFKYQNSSQVSLISLELFNTDIMRKNLKDLKSQLCILSARPFTAEEKEFAKNFNAILFYVKEGNLFIEWSYDNRIQKIISLKNLSAATFLENWVFILSTLYLMGKDLSLLESFTWEEIINSVGSKLCLEPHRVEYCGKAGDIEFYNDSKATIMEATLAALNKLSSRNMPIILFIGGVGKGVDRSNFLEKIRLNKNISCVVAFGKEANYFDADIKAPTLKEAFLAAQKTFKSNSIVLFSPSGASFDLFENYEKRGEEFKKLVREYEATFSKSTS